MAALCLDCVRGGGELSAASEQTELGDLYVVQWQGLQTVVDQGLEAWVIQVARLVA
jgi:hypothetical protein